MNMNQEIANAALALVRHIHAQNYSYLIISGGSNQVSQHLFATAWSSLYAEERMPRIFTINRVGNAILYKHIKPIPFPTLDDRIKAAQDWFDRNLNDINEVKNDRGCLIDEYAQTGGKFEDLKVLLPVLGFKHLDFAVFAAAERDNVSVDVYCAIKSDIVTERLYVLSRYVQGEPTFRDVFAGVEFSSEERKRNADEGLRDISLSMVTTHRLK